MRKTYLLMATPLLALIGAGGFSLTARAADVAMPETCKKGITMKISGQVNRAVLYAADHDGRDDVFFVDNDNSSSRVRWEAQGQINCDWSLGANFEVEWESNSSASIAYGQNASATSASFKERKIEVWFKGPVGTIWLGQGDTASNGTSEVDLSMTGVVAYSGIADFMGGLDFGSGGAGTGITIAAVSSQMDGLSRLDRVRYDSPTLAGFTLSTSYTDRDHWDVAVRYSQQFGDVQVAAAAAYADAHRGNNIAYGHQYNGSISMLHVPSGLNVTAAAGERKNQGDVRAGPDTDPSFYYVKLGWIANIFDLGPTAFAVDYQHVSDLNHANDEFRSWGFAVVQHIPHVGTELYAAVRDHELDRGDAAPDPKNQWGVMAGARVKF